MRVNLEVFLQSKSFEFILLEKNLFFKCLLVGHEGSRLLKKGSTCKPLCDETCCRKNLCKVCEEPLEGVYIFKNVHYILGRKGSFMVL